MKNQRKKSKGTWLWITLLLLLVLLIAASVVRATITHYRKGFEEAFTYSEQYTKEELEELHKDLNYDVHDTLKETLPEANMSILNERDRRKLSEGELNPEQTAEIFREARKRAGLPEREEPSEPVTEPSAGSTAFPSTAPAPTPFSHQLLHPGFLPTPSPVKGNSLTATATPTPVLHRDVDAIIEDFYILKSKYITNLDALLRRCKVEWRSRPKSERTFSARLAMAEKCIRLGHDLEAECDAEMTRLMAELKAALTDSGQSTSIISQIQAVYDQEKQLKKAALIDRYYPS